MVLQLGSDPDGCLFTFFLAQDLDKKCQEKCHKKWPLLVWPFGGIWTWPFGLWVVGPLSSVGPGSAPNSPSEQQSETRTPQETTPSIIKPHGDPPRDARKLAVLITEHVRIIKNLGVADASYFWIPSLRWYVSQRFCYETAAGSSQPGDGPVATHWRVCSRWRLLVSRHHCPTVAWQNVFLAAWHELSPCSRSEVKVGRICWNTAPLLGELCWALAKALDSSKGIQWWDEERRREIVAAAVSPLGTATGTTCVAVAGLGWNIDVIWLGRGIWLGSKIRIAPKSMYRWFM